MIYQFAMIGSEIVRLTRVDSTNDEAKRRLATDTPPPHGTVIVAARQTRGRGLGDRRWLSNEPGGLWLSIVMREFSAPGPPSFLPAVALARLLRRDHGIDAHLKWPNDVLVGSRKISGVLCEILRAGDGRDAWILGVGINVNQQTFPAEIRDVAVSMRQLSGREYDPDAVLRSYLVEVERTYVSRESLVTAWRRCTRMIGRRVRAIRRGELVLRTVRDVDEQGRLVVEADGGEVETWVSAGDLEIAADFAS